MIKRIFKLLFFAFILPVVTGIFVNIASAATLTVNVINGDTLAPMANVGVVVMSFDSSTGEPDPAYTKILMTVSGSTSTVIDNGREYFIAVTYPGFMPTVRDELMDPRGAFFVKTYTDLTKNYRLFEFPAGQPVSTLEITVATIPALGDTLLGEVYFTQTGEPVAYGLGVATDTDATILYVLNVPKADAGELGYRVSIAGENKAKDGILTDAFPGVASALVDMLDALPPMKYEQEVSTTPPSVEGVVITSNTLAPIEGARVELSSWVYNAGNDNWEPKYRFETFTDANGRFVFYDIPNLGTDYNLYVKKLGYESDGDNVSSMPFSRSFELKVASYTLEGYFMYNDNPVPSGEISVYGDDTSWNGSDSYANNWQAGMRSDARTKTDGAGFFSITGLGDGNLRLYASFKGGWYEFNSGTDTQDSGDDMRITISSVSYDGKDARDVFVFNATGASYSTGSVIFNIASDISQAGEISGNVTFISTFTIDSGSPLRISSSSPVSIMAVEQWRGGSNRQKVGFTSISGILTNKTTSYTILVSSDTEYYVQVLSEIWGEMSRFDTRADLSSTGTVHMNFILTRSGALKGIVQKPDGKNYRPKYGPEDDPTAHWMDVEVRGVNTDVYSGIGVDEFGAFEFPNLAPGIYNIKLKPEGLGAVWPPAEIKRVAVRVGTTTKINVRLNEGLMVQPQIFGLPVIPTFPAVSTVAWVYIVIAVDSGQKMNQKKITELFFSEPIYVFDYDVTYSTWSKLWMKPGQYDFYLFLGSRYNPGSDNNDPPSYHQFANFIGQIKNAAIKKSDSNPNLGAVDQPIPISILGSVGQSYMTGEITGNKIFTPRDFERIFANFDEIFPLIPAIMLYDMAGDLRGFAHALPPEAGFPEFETGLMNKNSAAVISNMETYPYNYLIPSLPPGKYTAVFVNPNYPPMTKDITLPLNTTYNFDFDSEDYVASAISGHVKDSQTGGDVENATVYIKHRMVERIEKTGVSGDFAVTNLPPGIYRIEASKDGYVTAGEKISLAGGGSADLTFSLIPSTHSITGVVYTRKFPSPMTMEGIKVIAYNETQNVTNPAKYLTKYETRTSANGRYVIPSVIPGSTYTVAAIHPGKSTERIYVYTTLGPTTASEMVIRDAPPEIIVKIKKSYEYVGKIDIIIKSPKELRSTPVCSYNPGDTYDETSAVSLTLVPGPNNTYLGRFTPSPNETSYAIYVAAGEGQNKLKKTIVYDLVNDARTDQYVNDASIEGGEVYMDQEREEYSGIELDPGSLTATVSEETVDFSNLIGGFFSALPSVRMVRTERGTSQSVASAIEGLMASDVYNLNLSNAQQNKSFTLTLKYDKQKVTNTSGLKIYQYSSNGWIEVPGNYTVDPMTGVLSVEVASLERAYEGDDTSAPLGRRGYGMSAISPQGTYVPNASGPSSQTGQFAVFTAKPPTGVGYDGTSYEIYNMPNPFDLKTKTINVSSDGSGILGNTYTLRGTLIKYHLPSGNAGNVKFLIYNLAGELVREIDEGARDSGFVYYSEWDGKNDSGTDCASGIYFLLTQVDGKKIGVKAHKMALVK